MARAICDGVVSAESDDVHIVEGMTYFPIESVREGALVESPVTSRCFWKGKASYFHVEGESDTALDSAFVYENPWPLARKQVAGRIAFWRDVDVVA